jgi:hypothetical protein
MVENLPGEGLDIWKPEFLSFIGTETVETPKELFLLCSETVRPSVIFFGEGVGFARASKK